MKLEFLMSYRPKLGTALEVGVGPYGNRLIYEVDGGDFEGPKLKGTIRKAGGADWLTMCEDYAHLDVRVTFETHDGAFIYVEYVGRFELTPAVRAALAGDGDTDYGEANCFTAPRLQTGDERYKWVNNIICVAEGRIRQGRVEYKVYQVVND